VPPDHCVDVPVRAPLDALEAQALADRLSAVLSDGRTRQVVCVVSGSADLATVDLLARLHLRTRRHGVRLTVRTPDDDLMALLQLTGLAEVLHCEP
jgi:anti-anti-sigma regulatory factor